MTKIGTIVAVIAAIVAGQMALAQQAAPLIAQSCAGCHGQDGAGMGSSPAIAGYDQVNFVTVWNEFRNDERPATIMNRIARGYTEDEVAELAAYFASLQ